MTGKPKTWLCAQHQKFVDNYTSGGMNARAAAIDAGYSPRSASVVANRLINEHAGVRAAIGRFMIGFSEKLEEKASYKAEHALAEIEKAMEFALLNKNPGAVNKLIEMKMKMSGLLEKEKVSDAPFQINILGLGSPSPEPRPLVITLDEEDMFS